MYSALCSCVFRTTELHCLLRQLHRICTELVRRHNTLTENTTLEIKRATASTNHIYSFVFILLHLFATATPLEHPHPHPPTLPKPDNLATHTMELLGLLCAFVLLQDIKRLCTIDVSRFYTAWKLPAKYFVVPAILLIFFLKGGGGCCGKQRCQQLVTVLCMLCCLRLDVEAVVLCMHCSWD